VNLDQKELKREFEAVRKKFSPPAVQRKFLVRLPTAPKKHRRNWEQIFTKEFNRAIRRERGQS